MQKQYRKFVNTAEGRITPYYFTFSIFKDENKVKGIINYLTTKLNPIYTSNKENKH